MSGVKGRSGRRPRSVEQKRLATIDRAWKVIDSVLKDKNIPNADKVDIAKTVVGRDISRKQSHQLERQVTYITETPRPQAIDTEGVIDVDGKVSDEPAKVEGQPHD